MIDGTVMWLTYCWGWMGILVGVYGGIVMGGMLILSVFSGLNTNQKFSFTKTIDLVVPVVMHPSFWGT